MFRLGKSVETENRLEVANVVGEKDGENCISRY